MRLDGLDFNPHTDALLAVVVGALLGTFSVVIANQFESFFRRREREKAAALLVGEVLSTLRVVLVATQATRAIGEPYGQVTKRMLHAARREVDFYERNREALLDLRDARLRVDIHTLVMRTSMPLDGILDSLLDGQTSDEARNQGFNFMMENIEKFPELIGRLGKVAGYNFDHYDDRLGSERLGLGGPPVIDGRT